MERVGANAEVFKYTFSKRTANRLAALTAVNLLGVAGGIVYLLDRARKAFDSPVDYNATDMSL